MSIGVGGGGGGWGGGLKSFEAKLFHFHEEFSKEEEEKKIIR